MSLQMLAGPAVTAVLFETVRSAHVFERTFFDERIAAVSKRQQRNPQQSRYHRAAPFESR
jgi:hypothetical protein